MSPIDRIAVEYARRGLDFASALERNYAEGFVFSTPAFFIMGRPKPYALRNGDIEITGDAWWIDGFAGDCSKAWSILPYELSLIGFERFDDNPRFYSMETLRRLTVHEEPSMAATA